MTQPTLFDLPEKKLHKLLQYHYENPHLYQAFKKYTFEVIRKGYKYFGAQMIIEKIRWEEVITANNSEFKISNDIAALYSRLFMKEYPTYAGYFRIRPSIADNILND